jgi:Cof subfamily protein (haloacid dehalogenase superfamily)
MPIVDCKLFVTDLDGTVLIDEKEAGCRSTPRLKHALRALEARGTLICLASGRMHESIRIISRDLGVQGPVISYNGAMLRSHDDEMLIHHTLDAEVAAEVVQLAHDRKLPLNFYCDGLLYARKIQPWWDLYQGRSSSPMKPVDSLLPMLGQRPTKLLFCAPAAVILALRDELTPRFAGRATVLITADEYLEIMPLDTDKGHALADLAERLGLSASDVVAAGDGNNDIGMISYAGVGIAISNGREALKQKADVVVGPPEVEGLAIYIEQYLL